MKVEVCIVKKSGKKVEVTLAKSKHRDFCVSVPVRVAPKTELIDDMPTLPAEEIDKETCDSCPECEEQPEFILTLEETHESPLEEEPVYDEESFETDNDIDEDELLALIAEEEAEMAAQQNHLSSQSSFNGYSAREYADDATNEEYVQELASEVQELVDEFDSGNNCTDDDLASVEAQEIVDELNLIDAIFDSSSGVLEDGVCTAEEAQDLVDEATAEEDSFDKYGGKGAESPAATEQYVRYFDRSTNGERVEVADPNATGQEIICVDGESGKISRVCGFIRHEKSTSTLSADED